MLHSIIAMPNTTEILRKLKGVTFASQNIRSVYPKMDDIKQLLSRTELDFLLLQETFLNDGTPDVLLDIDNYNMFRLDRDTSVCKKTGGGLLAYCNDKYEVEWIEGWSVSTKHLEIMWLKLKLPHTRPAFIANLYRPPGGDLDTAISILDNKILEINMSGVADILILGDTNINIKASDTNSRKWCNSMKNNLLHQLIKSATRITNTSSTIIDHVWVSNQDFYVTNGSSDCGWSDHHLIYVSRKRQKIKRDVSYIQGRSYRQFDGNNLYRDVSSFNWIPLYCINDVDQAASFLSHALLSIFDKHAPIKKIKCKTNQAKWVTGEFLSLLDEREHIGTICSKHPTQHNFARKRDVNRQIKQMKRALKRNYIADAIESCRGDTKKTWKIIKELWPNKQKQTRINKLGDETEPIAIANKLNTQFCEAGPSLARKYEDAGDPVIHFNDPQTSFQLSHATHADLWKLLQKVSPSKACGVDGITARLIRACGDAIIEPLLYVINLSIDKCVVPLCWKMARVTPLHKGGSTNDPNCYRPISVLPLFSKFMERLVHNQLYSHLDRYQMLSDSQSGFRKADSTTTCLVDFLDAIYNNIEQGRLSGVAFLDLKKAFDTVDHKLMLSKLSNLNISYRVIRWFASYLENRSQVTKISNITSEPGNLDCGVPQGSILGLLLFIIYIDSLPAKLGNYSCYLYTDDTAIVTTGDEVENVASNLENALTISHEWIPDNKLSLSLSKTKVMFLGTTHKTQEAADIVVKCNNEVVQKVNSFKYLGIMIDKNLKFSEHVDYTKKKLFAKMKSLGRVRQFVNKKLALDLYRRLIIPHMDYGDIVYDAIGLGYNQKLQTIQNSCLRICCRADPRTPIASLHEECKLPKLDVRRKLHVCNFVHKGVQKSHQTM